MTRNSTDLETNNVGLSFMCYLLFAEYSIIGTNKFYFKKNTFYYIIAMRFQYILFFSDLNTKRIEEFSYKTTFKNTTDFSKFCYSE